MRPQRWQQCWLRSGGSRRRRRDPRWGVTARNGMALQQRDDSGLRELALFAGAGGGILGGKLLGWRTVCAVEINDYCRRLLMQRQDDGCLPAFPIWDDVTTFDGRPWAGLVDVVSGGFPCQDISSAGKGAGIDGERSGLWTEMARIIGEVRPRFAFVENSPALTFRGLGTVLGDLAALGFDARWGVVSAADAIWSGGTPILDHLRERIWIVAESTDTEILGRKTARLPIRAAAKDTDAWLGNHATTNSARLFQRRKEQRSQRKRAGASGESTGAVRAERADSNVVGFEQVESQDGAGAAGARFVGSPRERRPVRRRVAGWWESEPSVGRVAHGVANRVDRLAAIGNGQVPAVAALAWKLLTPDR